MRKIIVLSMNPLGSVMQALGDPEIEADGLHPIAEASEDQGKTWRKDLGMAYVKNGKPIIHTHLNI